MTHSYVTDAPSGASATRKRAGFFAYHGPWAPGVRLFRRLSFGWKATLVSLCFLVPLALVMTVWLREVAADIEFSSQERAGVVAAQALVPLHEALIEQRRATLSAVARGGAAPGASDAVGQALRRAEEALADHPFGTRDAWAALKKAHSDAGSAAPDLESQYAAQGAVLQAYTNLVLQVSDGSNLTLDPAV